MLITGNDHLDLRARLMPCLAVAALPEAYGYRAQAKLLRQRLGTFGSARCRAINFEVLKRSWALDAVLDQLVGGRRRAAPQRG